ncbi:MAG: chromosome segregation protein SMC [Ruminococcaceae bacterium]|nr:chromosome segregation protein SMC [Oscillospiraceae bacterium]
MLLSSIQVQGFKSFADKTVLKFGKGITAVVGPNGSGKSNISDAVRWVLGEQSTKSLRGQSMEDVIFGGTETRRPHGFCEVTLNIDNTDRSLNFDNDFVSVTRRYYRSHESEYLINNVSVRLKDVHELFMDTGLGRDGYSMIGQGKIDNIISTRSDDRRDIFEEASGISKYRYRKIEAERKLAAADDNLLRLRDIMEELEGRVEPLREQSAKAEKFLKLAEEKRTLEIGLWLYTLENSKETLRSQESKIAAAQLQYKDIEAMLSDFDSETERNSAEFARLTEEIENKRAEISALNEEIVKISGNITLLKNDIQHNSESVLRLEGDIKELDASDSEAKSEIEAKLSAFDTKTAEVTRLEEELSTLEDKLSSLLSDSESISRKIEEQARRINSLTAEISDKRVEKTTSKAAIEQIIERKGIVSGLIEQALSEKQTLENEFKEVNEMLSKTEEEVLSCNNSLKGYTLRRENRNALVEELKRKSDDIRLDIETKKRRIQLLSELENNMEGFSHSVKAVMAEAEKGILRGVHNPVSKIITVDKKYSVAIETALGNAIQNIVVDNEDDAKRAINYLKSNNKGRATFLPISSITAREFKEKGYEDMYGYVGIAADLVKNDKKYNEIIRYLLGGAVVTEDIDSAVSIAKKFGYRIKIVTLDGQVINVGGSFTGGSRVSQAGILSRVADIKRLEEEIVVLEEKSKTVAAELTSATEALAAVDADITAVNADLINANEDKIRVVAELKRIEEKINTNNATLRDLEAERADGESRTKALEASALEADAKILELQTEKNNIQSEIDSMTGGRDSLADTREALSLEITELKLKIIDNKKDAESLKLSADALSVSIESRTERSSEISSEIAALTFKNEKLNADIDEFEDKIELIKKQITDDNAQIDSMIAERNETERRGVEIRTNERERTLERERIGGELARLLERKEMIAREYDDVIRQLYDEYQLTKSEAENMHIEIEKPQESKRQLAEIKSKIRSLGNVNVSAIEEYKEVSERYEFLSAQISDVENSKAQLHSLINQLTSQMQELFIDGFNKINENFGRTFVELFGGGSASLSLSNPENVLESGIDINVKLPGKNVPSLDGLSGGEKALIALSIYFAIMRVNAPPFCFLDEVDTALDDINVERFADYMKQSGFKTQFICVTHRRGTMEAADMLYGVTMQEKGVTKLLELNVAELEKKLLA